MIKMAGKTGHHSVIIAGHIKGQFAGRNGNSGMWQTCGPLAMDALVALPAKDSGALVELEISFLPGERQENVAIETFDAVLPSMEGQTIRILQDKEGKKAKEASFETKIWGHVATGSGYSFAIMLQLLLHTVQMYANALHISVIDIRCR